MTAEKIGDQCIAKMIVTFHRNRGRANRLQQEILRGRLYLIEDLLLSKRVKEFGLYHQSSHEAKAIREQALATLVSINLSKIQVNFQKNKKSYLEALPKSKRREIQWVLIRSMTITLYSKTKILDGAEIRVRLKMFSRDPILKK